MILGTFENSISTTSGEAICQFTCVSTGLDYGAYYRDWYLAWAIFQIVSLAGEFTNGLAPSSVAEREVARCIRTLLFERQGSKCGGNQGCYPSTALDFLEHTGKNMPSKQETISESNGHRTNFWGSSTPSSGYQQKQETGCWISLLGS